MLSNDGDVGAQSPLSQHESNVQADDARARDDTVSKADNHGLFTELMGLTRQ